MIGEFALSLLKHIEKQKITITQWVTAFISIVFVRFMLESLSSPSNTGIIPSDPYTLVHYGLFWITLTLGVILITGFFIKSFAQASKVALFGLPIIWIAPILDILISRGDGYRQLYIFDTGERLLMDFLTFFGPNLTSGATYGMRIEMVLVLIGIGWYVIYKTKSYVKSVLAIVSVYMFGFFLASLPGIIYTITNIENAASTKFQIASWFENIIYHSNIFHNTLHDGTLSVAPERFLELAFNKFQSQILFIISFILSGILFFNLEKEKFLSIIKNARLERINFYTMSLACGMGFAYINLLGTPFSITDILGITCLFIAWASLWMNAVHTNDIADIDIDKISNPERPLVKKDVDQKTMEEVGYLWLSVALLGAWCAGFYPFFMALVYVAASYIYSTPPLRLRRFPIIPSFLIGVACLATILAGFFFVSINKDLQIFSIFLASGIVIMVALAINFKDLKDVEGDREEGIMTIPVLFGERGTKIVGWCMAISMLLVPIFLKFYLLFVFAIPAAIIGYRLVIKKPYNEKPIFVLRFVFLSCIAVSYLLVFWLGHVYNII